jgi:hypothetical protein
MSPTQASCSGASSRLGLEITALQPHAHLGKVNRAGARSLRKLPSAATESPMGGVQPSK